MKDVKIWNIIFLLGLVPYFLISLFNHPSEDDLAYAVVAQDLGLWKAQVHWYTAWTGRYFSTLLLSFNPVTWHSFEGYKYLAPIVLVGLWLSIWFLIEQLLCSVLSGKSIYTLSLAMFNLFLYRMPSVAEGVYWMTGSITYTLCLITLNPAVGVYIHHKCIVRSQENKSTVRWY